MLRYSFIWAKERRFFFIRMEGADIPIEETAMTGGYAGRMAHQ